MFRIFLTIIGLGVYTLNILLDSRGILPSVNKKRDMVEKKRGKWKKKEEDGKEESWNALSERGASL